MNSYRHEKEHSVKILFYSSWGNQENVTAGSKENLRNRHLYGSRILKWIKNIEINQICFLGKCVWHLYGEQAGNTIKSRDVSMFLTTSFTMAKRWKWPRWPSTNEWIPQMWSIYTIEYYSALKGTQADTCYMSEPWEHYAKWKKPDTKG